ncbi:MAG: hypothetical protein J6T10_09580 [Methanobrevibacter sp.]|nr:hypothetical protein [Methanobrevibacter sp.]
MLPLSTLSSIVIEVFSVIISGLLTGFPCLINLYTVSGTTTKLNSLEIPLYSIVTEFNV